jgi:hypothetical protein
MTGIPSSRRRRYLLSGATLLTVLLIGVGVGLSGAAADEHAVTLTVEAPDEVEPGETVTLSVRANATHEVYGVDFSTTYDPDRVEVVQVSSGEFLSEDTGTIVGVASADPDEEQISYAESRMAVDSGVTGEGRLATITVRIDANATGTVDLEFTEAEAVDPDVEALEVTTHGATVELPDDGSDTGGSENESDTNSSDGTPKTPPPQNGSTTNTSDDGPGSTPPENGSETNASDKDSGTTPPDEESGAAPADKNVGTDSSDNGTTDAGTATDAVTSNETWSADVDSEVRSRLDSEEWVGVRVYARGDLTPVANALRESGAIEVQRLETDGSVAAFVRTSSVRVLANRDDVTRIERDETTATLDPGTIEVTGTTLPSEIATGSDSNVTVVLVNPGDTDATDEVVLRLNGEPVIDREVVLAPDERVELSFEVTFDEPENATLSLAGTGPEPTRLGTVTVGGAATSIGDVQDGDTDTGHTQDDVTGFGVLTGLIALVLSAGVTARSQ